MAEKKTYPTIPIKNWWALRDKFKQKIPNLVTPDYVATALNMTEQSAKANIIPALEALGIIDGNGKTLEERAIKWRDDEYYPELCKEIRQEIYPPELIDALPGPNLDSSVVVRWFMNKTGVGQNQAQKMAAVYVLLTQADPARSGEDIAKGTAQTRTLKTRPVSIDKAKQKAPVPNNRPVIGPELAANRPMAKVDQDFSPSIHIDLQIHISPEASAEQIDQIFASIARHMFGNPHASQS